ncbi:Proteasome subunit beta type-3 [Castilleja foliolosa]|uniref:Proteasome subunit beta type-3 n=1 Tax=Castilleja foliolosa TaxID=1961234 RepID=A0ABD3BZM0_9LAMI
MEAGSGNADQSVVPEQPVVPEQQPVVEQPVVKSIPTRRARKPTRMARLTLRYPGKVKIVFDSRRLMAIGPQKKIIDNFKSYLGFLGRKQPSILIKSWNLVSANTKELIWLAILIFFVEGDKEVEFSLVDVKLRDKFRRKWVNYVGRRWTVFKTNLTTTFIYGKKKDKPPYVKDYEFLDKETWEAFVALRLSEEEKTKRLKAQETQSHNKCPQRCSRGGYEVLSQKIIDEKYNARQVASDDPSEIIPPPSPPSRHETWKRARLKPTGEFINQETSVIAAKIDALEQEQSSGSFTPSGRNDILAVAIGKPDHPTRVRGVGKGYTVRTYFGKQQCAGDGMVSREEMAAIIAETKAEMQAEMRMILSSQATSAGEPHTPVIMSAKGSCAVDVVQSSQQEEEEEEEHGGNEVGECELYVEDPHRRLVAYGRIHELGSNIHHRKMNGDEVRVSVERIIISDALVPFPTEEVTKVGEASNQFVAWPRRLVVENVKGNSQRELFPKNCSQANQEPQATPVNKMDVLKTLWIAAADIKEPKILCIEAGILSLTRTSVHINQVDIMGLLATGMISVSVMNFYNKCLYGILKSSGRAGRYGLMCPLNIQTHGNNEDMGRIRNRIGEGGFDCFLLPFYDKGWELMALCPKYGCITWFSCTGKVKKPKKKFPEMIETKCFGNVQLNFHWFVVGYVHMCLDFGFQAFEAYHVMKGMRSNTVSKPKWVYPKCCQQDAGDAEFGLFVMRHMLEIIKLDVTNSFEKVLTMEEPYSSEDMDDVRRRWAECFLEVM